MKTPRAPATPRKATNFLGVYRRAWDAASAPLKDIPARCGRATYIIVRDDQEIRNEAHARRMQAFVEGYLTAAAKYAAQSAPEKTKSALSRAPGRGRETK